MVAELEAQHVGHDRYDLYIRRSFDGGVDWTTTPGDGTDSEGAAYEGDGTVVCRTTVIPRPGRATLRAAGLLRYAAGAAEQPRNVTQHKSMRTTTLDRGTP
jgi:hypothetical protein